MSNLPEGRKVHSDTVADSLPPIAMLAQARLRALVSSPEAGVARQAEQAWLHACAAYREARSRDDGGSDLLAVQGLRFSIPHEVAPRGLSARLRDGWLPWHDVLNRWSLGIGSVAIDIGANIGTTAILRVLAGYAQRVYALEPDPDNYTSLVRSIVANDLAGFILPDACAISDATGTGALRRADKIGNHHLVTAATPGSRHKSVPVRTMTLDDWMQAYGVAPESVSFVKVDVQGWEPRVLAGARRLLSYSHVVWSLEVSPKHLELAGTPMPMLLEQIAALFTHAIDTRRKGDPICTRDPGLLAERLAHIGPGQPESYTNLLLYRVDA